MNRLRSSIRTWRTARNMVLGSILMSGVLATTVAVYMKTGCRPARAPVTARALTYSGIGISIEQSPGGQVYVREVFPGTPAEGVLAPGMRLVAVDGARPGDSIARWSAAIRGEAGTPVQLEVAFHCGGHRLLHLTRETIRVAY